MIPVVLVIDRFGLSTVHNNKFAANLNNPWYGNAKARPL